MTLPSVFNTWVFALIRKPPGVNVKTSADDFYPIEREMLARFDGKTWVLQGKVYGR